MSLDIESARSTKRPVGGALCRVDILVDPYRGLCHPSWCFLKSGVTGGFYPPLRLACINRFLSGIVTGRVREPMYWYRPCALLSGGTAARADAIRPYRALPRSLQRQKKQCLEKSAALLFFVIPFIRYSTAAAFGTGGYTADNSAPSGAEAPGVSPAPESGHGTGG